MALNLPGVPFKLNAQDMGNFDLGAAIRGGLGINKQFQEARVMPQKLSEELLASKLQNKIDQAKAQYAMQNEAASLAQKYAGTGLTNLNIEKLRNEMTQQQQLNDLLGGGSPSGAGHRGYMTPHGFEGSLNGIPAESNYSNTGEDRQAEDEAYQRIMKTNGMQGEESYIPSTPLKQKISKGIPSINASQPKTPAEKMKFVYDNYPQFRARIKKMGYEPDKETLQQKMEREIATSNAKEKGKLEVDKSQKLLDQAKDLQLAGVDINGIHDILTGPDSLGTGITKTLIGKFGWGSEKLGSFNERALRLQTQMTKALSSRGGVGAAKIVASGKH